MTPAIAQARAAGIEFRIHDVPVSIVDKAKAAGSAEEALAALGLPLERVFKTLVAKLNESLPVVAVLPIACRLDLKRLASVAGARRAVMADAREAVRTTGYRLGAISPLGQRQRLPVFIDESAFSFPTIFVSGGRRGLELELSAAALRDAVDGHAVCIAATISPDDQSS